MKLSSAWLLSQLEGAGLAGWGVVGFWFRMICGCLAISLWSYLVTRIVVFALCVSLIAAALGFELLINRAKKRRREISALWPEVLDSLASAEVAGLSLAEAFSDLAEHAPTALRFQFSKATAALDSGTRLDQVLVNLKSEFGEVHADRLFELLRLVNEHGGKNYQAVLREQSTGLRREIALVAELETKQAWLVSTAKLAIIAPWLIVALLSSRPQNADIYNTPTGTAVLFGGLLLSAFAYRAIQMLGILPQPERVLR